MNVLKLYYTLEDIEWIDQESGIIQMRDNVYVDITLDDEVLIATLYVDEYSIESFIATDEEMEEFRRWIIEIQKQKFK